MDEVAFECATTQGTHIRQVGPHAISARYLATGAELRMPIALIEGLRSATAEDLREIEVMPAGLGLHFTRLDADVYVPALIEGVMGSGRWMVQQLGRAGGSAWTERKATAARENGKLGGCPRTRHREVAD